MKAVGHCHICGSHGPLTFEHIPPRRCFNNSPAAFMTIHGWTLAQKYGKETAPLTKHPRGMGRATLCEQCNQFTARHYGDAFARWTIQALEYSCKVAGANEIMVPFHIYPLRVIKQIATMALATADFAPGYQAELRRFVQIPFERYVPHSYRIYTYLNPARPAESLPPLRMTGTAATLDVTGRGGMVMILADIALPPTGYCVVAVGDRMRPPPDRELCDVTHFGNYDLNEFRTVWIRIHVKRPLGPAPLHFDARK